MKPFSLLSILCLALVLNQSSAFQTRKLLQWWFPPWGWGNSVDCDNLPPWAYNMPPFALYHMYPSCAPNPQPGGNSPVHQSPPHTTAPPPPSDDQPPLPPCAGGGSPPPKAAPSPSPPDQSSSPPPSFPWWGVPPGSNCHMSNKGNSFSWSCNGHDSNSNSNSPPPHTPAANPPTHDDDDQSPPKTTPPWLFPWSGMPKNCHRSNNGNSYSWSCGDQASDSNSNSGSNPGPKCTYQKFPDGTYSHSCSYHY
ncbi:OLC1v1029943C1 [Oldenlandia corymbosa var. corymbosa]|uniref:OLC1v1029943C1 n=1 Tax=Oldenlandia corymbosa var. corymbosa TaxID=529605 RepID=A0AAV1CEU9_OLDCO|nr:OLC1v1029943C1 [Oldenlandia corymbosa var. corymbosa]